jgi:threonine/homoserine/homoserine lactone efflux protein
MYRTRRIKLCKWTGALFAVLLLSQSFSRWRDFQQLPTGRSYAAILIVLSLFLGLMALLAVVVYAEEKAKGRVTRTRPRFDRWSDRFFLKDR